MARLQLGTGTLAGIAAATMRDVLALVYCTIISVSPLSDRLWHYLLRFLRQDAHVNLAAVVAKAIEA